MLHASFLFWERSKNCQWRFRQFTFLTFHNMQCRLFPHYIIQSLKFTFDPWRYMKKKRGKQEEKIFQILISSATEADRTCRTFWILTLNPKMSHLITHTLDLEIWNNGRFNINIFIQDIQCCDSWQNVWWPIQLDGSKLENSYFLKQMHFVQWSTNSKVNQFR